MPGWNEFILDAKEAASDAYDLWHQWDKPKQGPIFQLMQRCHARYKYAIRYCRQHESRILADSMAHWFSHYKTLFTSVGYDCNTVEGIISETSLPSVDELKLVSCTEVCDIVDAMSNKRPK